MSVASATEGWKPHDRHRKWKEYVSHTFTHKHSWFRAVRPVFPAYPYPSCTSPKQINSQRPNSIQSIWITITDQHYHLLLIWHAYPLWLQSNLDKVYWRNNETTKPHTDLNWLEHLLLRFVKTFLFPQHSRFRVLFKILSWYTDAVRESVWPNYNSSDYCEV